MRVSISFQTFENQSHVCKNNDSRHRLSRGCKGWPPVEQQQEQGCSVSALAWWLCYQWWPAVLGSVAPGPAEIAQWDVLRKTHILSYKSLLSWNHTFIVSWVLMNIAMVKTISERSSKTYAAIQTRNNICLLQMVESDSMKRAPWPVVTYINPLPLREASKFKTQVERCLPSQPAVLNFHIPTEEAHFMCTDTHKHTHVIIVWKKLPENMTVHVKLDCMTVWEACPHPDPTTFTSHSKHPVSPNGEV